MTKQQETRKVLFGCIAFVGICGLISSIIYHKEEDNCCVDVVLEPIEKEKKFIKLYNIRKDIKLSDKDFECLARNIYRSARKAPAFRPGMNSASAHADYFCFSVNISNMRSISCVIGMSSSTASSLIFL